MYVFYRLPAACAIQASTASGSLEILLSDSQNRTVFRFNSREECVQAHEAAEERDKDSFIVREMNHMDVSQVNLLLDSKYTLFLAHTQC